jgi:ubiquinone/menaquinone biosynthesis C-methylase UbiE
VKAPVRSPNRSRAYDPRPTIASVRTTYDYYFELMRGEPWFVFMNHGYAPLMAEEAARLPDLLPEDDAWRHQVYLYLYLVEAALSASCRESLTGLDLLDVGCGRGGGLSVLRRYHRLGRAVGLDLNAQQIAFCRSRHEGLGLEFQEGNSMALPFPDASFDLICNVESLHCYPSRGKFLREVYRVLKPHGQLLFADTCVRRSKPSALEAAMRRAGLEVVSGHDISANVREACALDESRFASVFESEKSYLPRTVAADKVKEYAAGALRYLVKVLSKPAFATDSPASTRPRT